MEKMGLKEYRVYAKLTDLVSAFGSKAIIITHNFQGSPRGVEVPHEVDGKLLKFYVNNPEEFDQVLKVYPYDGRHLKSFIPVDDFRDEHKPLVEIFDVPDEEGVGIEPKSISEEEFLSIVGALEREYGKNSCAPPMWAFTLFILAAIALFVFLNLNQ